ncbi:hypothetical protein ABVK25_000920 [Lepraria finkii]|uniref:F-box domain-containing protein n=1 Tax=Lepraria finkii TaxID=1340010 RepID=A0ABR4BQ92_9LECA
MAALLDLLSPYPILENLVSMLPLGDLFSLSKTNSAFRAALHGFQLARSNGESPFTTPVRPTLCIGQHETLFWRNLNAKSPGLFSESQHTRGDKNRGCLMCAMPVCEACIIKASFGKRDEKTFQHRTRSLCPECYNSETPHIEQSLKEVKGKRPIHSLSDTEPTCICTAKDGHLCLKCKTEQKSDLETKLSRCYGEGCSKTKPCGFSGRVCLWCDLRLPGERSRAEARRDYDKRHLLARTHSSFERPPEDEIIYPAEQEAIWQAEEERFRELSAVSEQRRTTASTAEDERWRRSEALRCSDSMFYPPPPVVRHRTDHIAESSGRQRSDSTASILVERDQPILPSYGTCSLGATAEESQGNLDSTV